MKRSWHLPRLLLSKAGVSPSDMNHFLQMHSAFSFKQFSEVIYLLYSGHLLLTTLSLGCFWKNSDNWVPCRKNFISGLHVLVNSYSYTAQYKPYSTDFPWALKMKKKFAIISFRNLMLGNGLDYSRERVACRTVSSASDLLRAGGQTASGIWCTGKVEGPWPLLSYWLARASKLELTGK